VIGLFAWEPWAEPTEVEWLGTYRAWSDELDESLAAGLDVSRADCEKGFDDAVGEPSQEAVQPAAAAARRACATPTQAGVEGGRAAVVRTLMETHDDVAPPRRRRDLEAIVRTAVGVQPEVYCWQPAGWAAFFEQYATVRGGQETSLGGIADRERNRIDLDPATCASLAFYVRRVRPTALSYENFEMAEGLTVLTHQAEHLKEPSTPEAAVECYAIQHVRPLVRAVWDAAYANTLATQEWELSYQQLPPPFRTPACRDGGRLDRNPGSSAWP
jgi:hypothetical protein